MWSDLCTAVLVFFTRSFLLLSLPIHSVHLHLAVMVFYTRSFLLLSVPIHSVHFHLVSWSAFPKLRSPATLSDLFCIFYIHMVHSTSFAFLCVLVFERQADGLQLATFEFRTMHRHSSSQVNGSFHSCVPTPIAIIQLLVLRSDFGPCPMKPRS